VNIQTIVNTLKTNRVEPPRDSLSIDERLPGDEWNEYVVRNAGDLYHLAQWEKVFSVYRLP